MKNICSRGSRVYSFVFSRCTCECFNATPITLFMEESVYIPVFNAFFFSRFCRNISFRSQMQICTSMARVIICTCSFREYLQGRLTRRGISFNDSINSKEVQRHSPLLIHFARFCFSSSKISLLPS